MKRKVIFVLCLVIAGTFAYYGGYYVYRTNNSKVELIEPESVQRAIRTSETKTIDSREYYVGKIEQDMLKIYKMPEESVYDMINLNSLSFYGNEKEKLLEGMFFENLTEVFEFLENSMS